MSEEKKIKSVKRYTIEVIRYEDDSSTMKRHNQGFSVIEMIGITEIVKKDMFDILNKALVLPSDIKRSAEGAEIINE